LAMMFSVLSKRARNAGGEYTGSVEQPNNAPLRSIGILYAPTITPLRGENPADATRQAALFPYANTP
jgi:hypothetical protein